ncbi:hypothetical protein D9758_018048 [Tetrapyrgos nigripes]|uniref:Uncharacterized protein n=1 Tax=Tetrapyrgos nigripes TaxID=182062 RepID=A0A8H5EYP3_9AGAR|nr:hypothetical protein D9758_018048 [Tetrapyrgos nigripes]
MYIALELCLGTLAEVVEGSSAWTPGMALNLNLDNGNGTLQGGASTFGPSVPNGKADLINIRESVMRDPKKALAQITRGLRHLHALKLVHRDIKPQNILVAKAVGKPPSKSKTNGINGSGSGGGYRMLISDFGLCKKLDVDQTSFLPTAQGAMAAGTVGWRAPEILRGEVRFDFDEIDPNNPNDASRGSTSTVTGGSVGSTVSGGSSSGKGKPTRLTKSVDIFALGCLFYYVLTGGSHPFGDRFEREVNILKGAKCLDGLERGWEGGFGSGGGGDGSDGAAEEGMEAAHLIRGMLEMESANRPDTDKILVHPFFWDAGKRLNFLQDASDRFEIMPRGELAGSTSKSASSSRISLASSKSFNGPSPYEGERDPHLIRLEQGASDIVGMDWPSRCDKVFIDNLGKFRKYDGKSVQDLLRALRNKKHHYQDLPENVKRHLGSMPEGYLSYFTRRYPKLFLHVHQAVDSSELSKEDVFRSYFESVE